MKIKVHITRVVFSGFIWNVVTISFGRNNILSTFGRNNTILQLIQMIAAVTYDTIIHNRSEVYKLYSPTRRSLILITGGLISILTPFTDTIYLPALSSLQKDLKTTESLVTLSVSIYLACVGLGQLAWGPLSDRYGRLLVIYGCLLGYEIVTIACIFAATIEILIAERAIQGFIVGTAIISVQAIISDVFTDETRGTAMGAFLGPMLIGPIIAPLIGGVLSDIYGWRSTFVLLAIFNIVIVFFTFLFVPETHHWNIRQASIKYSEKTGITKNIKIPDDPIISISVAVNKENLIESYDEEEEKLPDIDRTSQDDMIIKPVLMMPWEPLKYIFDKELAPFYRVTSISFMNMFTSLILLPIYLAKSPYNYNALVVGISFLPVGVCMLVGSVVGGIISDVSYKLYIKSTYGRMLLPLWLSFFNCLGCVGFGLTLQYQVQLAGPLLTQSVLGFGQAVLMSSIMGYVTSVKPDNAGAVGSILLFLCFGLAAIGISFSIPIVDAIGIDSLYYIFAALAFTTNLWAIGICIRDILKK